MSNDSSNDFWGWVVVIAIVVIGGMWIFDAGPFEKSSYNSSTHSTVGGNTPSFTGSDYKNSQGYKCTELGTNPQWRCKCKHQWMDINSGPICPYCHHRTVNHHN